MSFENFIDWQYLGSFSGIVSVVCLIVQFSKQLIDKLPVHIPTQIYSYLVSVVVILLAQTFEVGGDGLTLSEAVLALFNGVIVSIAASGSYDTVVKLLKKERNDNNE